ncbi:ferritin-like domain-containing protein [Magnetococcales bacterium HHB-1]
MDTVIDLVKTAILHEVRAGSFYSQAAEITKSDEARMVFLELAGMEDDHAQRLVKNAQKDAALEGFDAMAFLKSEDTPEKKKLSKREKAIIATGDMRAILNFAIQLEVEAEATYLKLAKKGKSSAMQEFCRDLAKEEAEHKRALEKVRNNLDMDAADRPAL